MMKTTNYFVALNEEDFAQFPPDNCSQCPLFDALLIKRCMARPSNILSDEVKNYKVRPEWCPLFAKEA